MAVDKQQLTIHLKAAGIKLTKTQLKQLDAQVNKTSRGLGGMAGAIAGATVALYAASRAFKAVVGTGKEFQQKMADVKAISGATATEFTALEKNARALGKTTVFTAANVGELSKEFAKLGFTASEIIKVTKGTLALASAVGSDLATSAATAGTTLRGFGLDVSETGRVTDVMALSMSKSALDMQKFTDSMKYVAPIAKLAGVSLEGTTAILGSLANAGIDGSMAGTSLRRILLEAGKAGSKLADRMGGPIESMEDFQEKLKRLRDEGFDPLTEGADLVGKRAVTAFAILLEGADKTDKLTEALMNAGGAAQEMADIQLDTLDGDLRKLSSATDELSIKMFDLAEESLRNVTQGMIDFVNSIEEGDILAYKKALELVIGSLILYKGAMVLATIWNGKFALSLTKTGLGAFVVLAGIAAAELMKYFKVFETEADKIEQATKLQNEFNDSVTELGKTIGAEFPTLEGAIDEYARLENILVPTRDTIDATTKSIADQEAELKELEESLGDIEIHFDKRVMQLQASIKEEKIYLQSLKDGSVEDEKRIAAIEIIIARYERLIDLQKDVTKTQPGPPGESVELTDEEKKAAEAIKWINRVNDVRAAVDEENIARQEAETDRLIELQYQYGEIGGAVMAVYEQHIESAQTVIDGFSGAIGAWEEKNAAEFEITRKKLAKDDKEELKKLKNSEQYLKASDKVKKQLIKDHEDDREDIKEKAEKAIADKEYETAQWRHGIAVGQSIIDTASAVMKALVSIPPNVPLSIAMAVVGAIQTGIILANPPKKPAQFGMNEIIDRPTNLLVGEGNTPELVQVTPLVDENRFGPGGGGSTINISFEGNVLSDDFIELEAIPKIREAVLRGESLS